MPEKGDYLVNNVQNYQNWMENNVLILLLFAFKGGAKLILDYLIMVQNIMGRKQMGDLV